MQRTRPGRLLRAALSPLLLVALAAGLTAQEGGKPAPAQEPAKPEGAKAAKADTPAAKGAADAKPGEKTDAKPKGSTPGTVLNTGAERGCGPRLQPGLPRLKTGVDLSKVKAGAGQSVAPETVADLPTVVATTESVDPTAPRAAAVSPKGSDAHAHHAEKAAELAFEAAQEGEGLENLPPGHATVLGAEVHDFGQLIQGTHASHVFQLVSDGENDLVISRIKPSCGCTLASAMLLGDDGSREPYVTGTSIAPGRRFEIEAAFKSDGKQGHTKTQVALYCNDPRAVISLGLEAEVQPVLVLEPRSLNLGTATTSQAVTGTMRVTSPTLPPFHLDVDRQFLQPLVAVELKPVEPDAEGRAGAWDVTVTLGPDLPEGMRNYPLRLVTDQPIPSPRDEIEGTPTHYFVIGYAQVQVEGLVSANPGYVPFGMVRPGQQLERVVRIECHDDYKLSADAPVKLTATIQSELFDYDKAFTTRIDPVPGENALDLTVRLEGLPDEASGSFGGMLKVDVGHPHKKELLIRFSGVCRPGLPDSGGKSQ